MPQRIADVLLAVPLAATALVMLFAPCILRDLPAVYLPALLTAWFTIMRRGKPAASDPRAWGRSTPESKPRGYHDEQTQCVRRRAGRLCRAGARRNLPEGVRPR